MDILINALSTLTSNVINSIETILSGIYYLPIFSNDFYFGYIIIGLAVCGLIFNILINWLGGNKE